MDPLILILFSLVQLSLLLCAIDSFRRLKKQFTEYLTEHRQRVKEICKRYDELVKKCMKNEW